MNPPEDGDSELPDREAIQANRELIAALTAQLTELQDNAKEGNGIQTVLLFIGVTVLCLLAGVTADVRTRYGDYKFDLVTDDLVAVVPAVLAGASAAGAIAAKRRGVGR